MYAFEADPPDAPKVLKDASKHVQFNAPMTVRSFPRQQLMDLEDWMEVPIRVTREDGQEVTLTARGVLLDAAIKFGAHYDEWIPHSLDELRSLGIESSQLDRFLCQVGETTAALGEHLIAQFHAASRSPGSDG